MILFFHFICFIARYIVLNISKTFIKPKVLSGENISEVISNFSSTENCPKRKLEYPKFPIYESGCLKFFPPVFVQRYETVAFTLQNSDLKGEIRKVVDFGCAELGFFSYLKSIESVTEILEVDIDSDLLERYSFKAAPLTSDYLMGKREKPLNVYILAGNVAEYDDCLQNCDAVVAIELIEHLTEENLNKLLYNIFYKIRPKIAIFTTPNADFNFLLPYFPKMRHKDHKFEWSRKEFYEWTQQILSEYPGYYVRFHGIGAGPDGTENLGCCSQMAVFRKLGDAESFVTSRDKLESVKNYKLIKHYEFPAYVDHRTTEEKIVHEIQYHAAYLKNSATCYNYETNKREIPLSLIMKHVSNFQYNDEELKMILSNSGMTLEKNNDCWVLVYSDTESNSSDCSENWLNEELVLNDSFDQGFEDNWSDGEEVNLEELKSFQPEMKLKFSEKLGSNEPDLDKENHECSSIIGHKNIPDSENCNCSSNPNNSFQKSPSLHVENEEIKKSSFMKSKIPCKISGKEMGLMHMRKKSNFHVCKSFKKISKSCSLDSWLENNNSRSSENSYLSLISRNSSPFHHISPLSSYKKKHWINYSGSSLLSSSFDKAGDSGYPVSFSPSCEDLAPEQVDELFTKNVMRRSTSFSSEIDNVHVGGYKLRHNIFIENLPVENRDTANSNRDKEGNNVEVLLEPKILNEIAAERNRNDNYFFPDIEEFPPWLLNLGELALQPVYMPLHESDNHEGLVDEDIYSNTDRYQSLDFEDLDIDF